jgi:hypothetical protein
MGTTPKGTEILPPKKHFGIFYSSAIEPKAACTQAESLNDSIGAAFLHSQIDLRGGIATEHGLFLQDGIVGLQDHIVNQPFRRDEVRIAAAKAACVAAWLQCQPPGTPVQSLRFRADQVAGLRHLQIQPPWAPLTRLKAANPQAFHYWYQA